MECTSVPARGTVIFTAEVEEDSFGGAVARQQRNVETAQQMSDGVNGIIW